MIIKRGVKHSFFLRLGLNVACNTWLTKLFALAAVLQLASGCRKEDSEYTVWQVNTGNMRQLSGDIQQLSAEGKAHSVADALKIIRQTRPNELKMYGFDQGYVVNPNIADFTNGVSPNLVIVEAVPLKHNDKTLFMGLKNDGEIVELEKLPSWANAAR